MATHKGTAKRPVVVKAKPAKKRKVQEHNPLTGFVVGSNVDKIATILLEGGDSRNDVIAKCGKVLKKTTSSGKPTQVGAYVGDTINRMKAKGFTIESTFRVVPPDPNAPAPVKKAAKKVPVKKAAPTPETVAEKADVPAKRVRPSRARAVSTTTSTDTDTPIPVDTPSDSTRDEKKKVAVKKAPTPASVTSQDDTKKPVKKVATKQEQK